ncbi:protein white [Diaphorina citri]|uniref:Protein white n=1 Tax=Diaphorina citri TaxID=121845 RepID=A0A3Q0IQC3_DIACI|nr:protein white [Diaphorina citri]
MPQENSKINPDSVAKASNTRNKEHSRKVNGKSEIKLTFDKASSQFIKGGGGPDPETPHTNGRVGAFPEENITYTWSGINVFTSGVEEQGSKLVNGVKNLFCKSRRSQLPSRKHILKNVTGVAYPGELLAIMGSSGAGKTTLLNTLTFRNSSSIIVNGQRAVNGIPINSTTLASLSAYVQQDDLFIGTLTVREHLIFQALVRMDRHIPVYQRMQRVEEVIADLALSKCQNTVIGTPGRLKGISGGEMKRLSFASEVLTNPPVMFCDEPTSGLDSFMAQNVVTVLKNMANKKKTIICTIHQPSSEVYAMFDKILLMAEGRVAFIGSPAQANEFFSSLGAACPSNYNPADYFIQLLAVVPSREETCRNTIEMVCDTFDRSEYGIKLAQATELRGDLQAKAILGGKMDIFSNGNVANRSPYKANWWTQFKAVLWRSWLSVRKDPTLMKVRLLQTLMVSIMIGLIYFGQNLDQDGVMNINGALFICLTNMTFQNVFAVISVFCSELPLFMREHQNGMYRVDVYFLCKTLAEVPIFLAIPVIFTSVMYYMVHLNPIFSRFLTATLIITMVSTVATSFGYLISCISSSVSVALSIGPPVIIPFLLFGGFFLNAGCNIQLLAVVPSREETCRNTIEMVCDTFDRSEYGIKLAQATELRGDLQAKAILGGKMDIFSNGNVANRSPYKANWWTQFKAVLWRSWLSVRKDPTLMKVRLLQTLMVSIMIGLIYFGQNLDQDGVMNINGALFICLTNMTFQNVFAVISVFCSELPLFMREHQNGMYRVDVYFLCKTLAEVPIFLAIPVIFTSVMYYMVHLNPIFSRFLTATLIITMVSTVATSFGYLISCISSSVSVALSIGPPVIIPFLLFGGFFLNAGSVPAYFKWLSYLSWFKYGNEALLINQWSGIDDIACTRANTTCPKNGQVVLETFNFSEVELAKLG